MSERPTVARNTERTLWAEAIGYCMNPKCQIALIKDGANIGEMAHIESHAVGGDVSFGNLVLLCGNCHTQIDGSRTGATVGELREWKKNRNNEIKRHFTRRYTSFRALQEAVTPILERNGQIFDNYGPSDRYDSAERHKLWLRFEGEIISNNKCLELMLTRNKELLHKENQEIVDEFVSHNHEFIKTRGDDPVQRECLFPRDLLSVFGVAEELSGVPPNLSALQNFVSRLVKEGRFVSLELNATPCVTYLEGGAQVILMLEDRARVQQVFWNGRFFKPKSTDVRIEKLVFVAQWLNRNKIRYEFAETNNLTTLVLNGRHKVRLCYEYVLSLAGLHAMALDRGDIVVNLYNWNDAPISKAAHGYAEQIGVQLFSQDEFFVFAHRSIK